MNHIWMGIRLFVLVQCLLLAPIFADDCPKIEGNIVIFGGLGSKTADMKQCYPGFLSLSYDDGAKFVNCLSEEINNSKGQKFVIAGHSSGAADAERVVRLVKDKTKVRLVLLEGYAYLVSQRGDVKTTCWYAENTNKKLQGFNAPSMLNPDVCPQPARAFQADWCDTEFCLHLANVNLKAPSDLSRNTVLTQGLADCRGNDDWVQENLDWLKSF